MEIEQVNIVDIVPYENNPRKNDTAVSVITKSIKEFGFLVPIILDDKNQIVAGHTRVKAAMKLGMDSIPAIYTEGLTQQQIDAFRIMDNKSQEYSRWDYDLLKSEIFTLKDNGFDLDLTGFKDEEIAFLKSNKDTDNAYDEWRKSGGLDYNNQDKTGYKTILLHFKEPQDVQEFGKLINQTITERTKYLWFPKQKEDSTINLGYKDE